MKSQSTSVEVKGQPLRTESAVTIEGLERADCQLILELLQAEQSELPGEIHHTDGFRLHEELIQRKEQVNRIIRRIHESQSA